MSGLKLIPNEIVGYRVRPDYHNWTVVSLKRHGSTSRSAGQVYESPVGYYRTLPSAFNAILQLAFRLEAEQGQQRIGEATGDTCSHEGLLEALRQAEQAVQETAQAFERDLAAAGVTLNALARRARPTEDQSPDMDSLA